MSRLLRIGEYFFMFSIVLATFMMDSPNHVQADSGSTFWFLATGDLRGEIKPCGCSSEGDMGGLLRRGTYLEKSRKAHPHLLYLDLGNNFPPPTEQGRLKVSLIQKSLKQLQPAAILVGPNELLYEQALLDPDLPYLLTNVGRKLPFKTSFLKILNGQHVGIWGYLSPNQVYQNANEEQSLLPVGAKLLQNLQGQLKKEKADYTILMFRGSEEELAQFEQSGLFDLIIAGNNNDDELNQVLAMNTANGSFKAVPTKGQGAFEGKVDVEKKSATLEVDWFLDKYSDHPALLPHFEAYDTAVKALFFTNLDRMDKHKQESPYAGESVCAACHLEEHQVWSKSGHAHAFATLEKEGKHFDLECLQCHVVGLNQGGFLSPELTPTLMNVQCENCHGAAKAHISNPQNIRPPTVPAEQACVSCHKGSHSPTFDFATYWEKIKH